MRSAPRSKVPLFFEGPWLHVTSLRWHRRSPSVYKSFQNILPLGWYLTTLLSDLCAEGRAPESYLKSLSCEVSVLHKLPGPRGAEFPSSGVCGFFKMELFLKMESYGKPVCQTETQELWLKAGSGHTCPGGPSPLRCSGSLLVCGSLIRKRSSAEAWEESTDRFYRSGLFPL